MYLSFAEELDNPVKLYGGGSVGNAYELDLVSPHKFSHGLCVPRVLTLHLRTDSEPSAKGQHVLLRLVEVAVVRQGECAGDKSITDHDNGPFVGWYSASGVTEG